MFREAIFDFRAVYYVFPTWLTLLVKQQCYDFKSVLGGTHELTPMPYRNNFSDAYFPDWCATAGSPKSD